MTTAREGNSVDPELQARMQALEVMTIAEARAYLRRAVERVDVLEINLQRMLRRMRIALTGLIIALVTLIAANLATLAQAFL